jgi:hypothetical protein
VRWGVAWALDSISPETADETSQGESNDEDGCDLDAAGQGTPPGRSIDDIRKLVS